MSIQVNILTEKKGSNPGGRCRLPYHMAYLDGYLKYCNSSELRGGPFRSQHQPIYEVLTVGLAERLGLEVPRVFLLENKDKKEVVFEYPNGASSTGRLDENRPFYFISKLARTTPLSDEEREVLRDKMAKEKLFRDLLMIGDVSKKEHNYTLLGLDSEPYVFYIDLGCSFVDAHDGRLSQRNSISQLLRRNGGSQGLRKDMRRAKQQLSRLGVITSHREIHRAEIVGLDELVDEVPTMRLPLFPYGNIEVKEVLSSDELDQITALLLLNMEKVMRFAVKSDEWRENIIS